MSDGNGNMHAWCVRFYAFLSLQMMMIVISLPIFWPIVLTTAFPWGIYRPQPQPAFAFCHQLAAALYVFMWSEYLISVHPALIDRHLGMKKRCSCMHALVACVIASVFSGSLRCTYSCSLCIQSQISYSRLESYTKTTLLHLRQSCFLVLRAFNQEE